MSTPASTPRLSEERLRTWLDATQLERERLCAAILPLLGPYAHVQLRRPKGGPDQSRDLEALINNSLPVWGAVGFRNQVSDSREDKQWVKKKFKNDLVAAKTENPHLTAFVFFTNIDLRPAEIRSLKEHAVKSGVSHCEVFYRERIRQILDSVQGMPYRLQYLSVQMSMEEQLAFFNAFGADLRTLLETQHHSVDKRLNALDFWLASVRPLRQFWIIIQLDRQYSFEELGHFRFSLKLGSVPSRHAAVIAGRDHVIRHKDENGEVSTALGTMTFVQRDTLAAPLVFGSSVWIARRSRLIFGADLFSIGVVKHLDELNHIRFDFSTASSLAERATSILLIGNRYELADLKKYDAREQVRGEAITDWPGPLTEKEKQVPLYFYGIGEINFDRKTLRKYELTLEDRQNLLS